MVGGENVQVRKVASVPRSLYRIAKLVGGHGECPCIVTQVCEPEVTLRLLASEEPAGSLVLEMGNGQRHALVQAAGEGDQLRARFAAPIDVAQFLSGQGPFPRRSIRVNLSCALRLVVDGIAASGELVDISREGLGLRTMAWVTPGQRLLVEAPGLPRLRGVACWRHGDRCGIALEAPLSLQDLATRICSVKAACAGSVQAPFAPRRFVRGAPAF